MPLIHVGGLIFGFGLAYSHMARPEVVLDFLQFDDFGLLFVMFGAAIVSGIAFAVMPRIRDSAPLTGDVYGRRLKPFDRNVLIGGGIFGVGWGLSGVCPAPPTPASGSATSRSCGRSSVCSLVRTYRASGAASAPRPTPPRRVPTNAVRISCFVTEAEAFRTLLNPVTILLVAIAAVASLFMARVISSD